MTEKQFVRHLASIPWPQFGGIGFDTTTKRGSYPRNSGMLFLGAMLRDKKVNGKTIFTTEAY